MEPEETEVDDTIPVMLGGALPSAEALQVYQRRSSLVENQIRSHMAALEKARDNLRPLRLANLHLLFGDGMLGYPKGAPYAAIIAAAGGEAVPSAWVEQLAVGGRLIAPTLTANGQQALVVIDKTPHGLHQQQLEAVHFVPLKSGVA